VFTLLVEYEFATACLHRKKVLQKEVFMAKNEIAHFDTGLKSILSSPLFYNIFIKIIGKKGKFAEFVTNVVRPFSGCKILDIGCGTGHIITYLPDSIGEYVGFDMNNSYIEHAKKQWKDRGNCSFYCEKVSSASISKVEHFDIVLAIGILHHLSDNEAADLLEIANQVLKPKGILITWDNVYIDNQHWFAKWFISKDRGQAVRTVNGYKQLVSPYFSNIEGELLHDTLKVPYTIFNMKCTKE
jgi:2-polyprenyl-3-methyl-5-hydroxy-6-metoxy-1,4-benzoquinol methylase